MPAGQTLQPNEVSTPLGCGNCGGTKLELYHVHHVDDERTAGQRPFGGILRALCCACQSWTDILLQPASFVFEFPARSAGCLGPAR